jgi:protocatechuate 3,4-dioxygenase beta subunit
MHFGNGSSDGSGRSATGKDSRRCVIEPLEQRQLLSVSVLPTARHAPVSKDAITVPVQVQVGSASGSVVDDSGKPIAGAKVHLTPAPTATPALAGVHGRRPKPHQLVAITGQDGTFMFRKVPTGSYTATASKDGFDPTTSAAFTVQQGANTAIPPITLKATPAPAVGSVSGSVTDSSGAPVAGAVVMIFPASTTKARATPQRRGPRFGPSPVQVTTTDKDGHYTFDQVPAGAYEVAVSAKGFQKATSASFTVAQGSNTAPTVALTPVPQPVLGNVTGMVTDSDGKPLAGAFVELSASPSTTGGSGGSPTGTTIVRPPLPIRVAITDTNGQYKFENVPAGTYTVTARDKGFEPATSAAFTVAKGDNTAPTLKLTAAPAPVVGNVSGLVTDSSGKPIAGALVVLSPSRTTGTGGSTDSDSDHVFPEPGPVQVAKTDSNGKYTFSNVPAGMYTVSAVADGFQRATSAPCTGAAGDNSAPTLALTAIPAPIVGSVTGTVTDSSGKPIAGALVAISPAGPIQPGPLAADGTIIFPPGPVQFAKTDTNGQYTFDKVPAGTYVVRASADGFQPATSAPFKVAAGTNTAPTLALTAIPAPVVGTVTGTVTDSLGKPISGAEVILSPAPANSGGGTSTGDVFFRPPAIFVAKTGANGQYTIDQVPAGTYAVSAAAEGFQRATSAPFTVKEGTNTAPTLALTPIPTPVLGTVTGTVTDSTGKALAGALVELSAVPAVQTGSGDGGTTILGKPFPIRLAITDDKGQYTFDDVRAGSYTVTASAQGFGRATSAPFNVAMGSNTAPTLALTALPAPVVGSVTGTITDAKGNPIASALVELVAAPPMPGGTGTSAGGPILFPPPQPVLFAKTDANGHYSFDKVPVGQYVVKAWSFGFQAAASAPFTVAQGSNTAPTLMLAAGGVGPPMTI